MAATINIGGQLHAATGDGIIAVASELLDVSLNKFQSQINSEKADKVTGDVSSHIPILDASGNMADSSVLISNESLTDSSYTVPTSHAINLELEELRLLAYAGL